LTLAHQQFRKQLQAVPRHVVRAPKGGELGHYINSHMVRVRAANGQREVAVSSVPLETPTPSGGTTPVDMTLSPVGAAFQPAHPIVPLSIPQHLSDGVSVGSHGVKLYVEGPGAADAVGTLSSDKVFYPDVAQDTDALVGPDPAGVETFLQLRAADSPEDQSLHFALPAGTVLKRTADGMIGVLGPEGTLGVLEPASATDAQGQQVPVSYEVAGDTVRMQISHRDGDYAYPILVDPVYEEFGNQSPAGFTDFSGWGASTTRWDKFTMSENVGGFPGLWISSAGTVAYNPGDSGGWWWNAWRPLANSTTYIPEVDWWNVGFSATTSGGSYPALWLGIWNGSAANWLVFGGAPGPFQAQGDPIEVDAPSGNTSGTSVGAIIFMSSANVPYDGMLAGIGGVVVYEDDLDAPTISGVTHSFDLAGWLGSIQSDKLGLDAADPSLGLYNAHVNADPNNVSDAFTACAQGTDADGSHVFARCPNSVSVADNTALRPSYTGAALPDGIDSVSATVSDVDGHATSTAPWTVKVDHTFPSLSGVGGSLNVQAQGKTAVLPAGTYDLHASASDQNSTHLTSGLTSLELKVDGQSFACWSWAHDDDCAQSASGGDATCNQSAATGSCTAPVVSGSVDTARFGAGLHTVSVEATDGANNHKVQSWQVRFAQSATEALGPGDLDLFTGNFQLTRDDVSIDNFGSSLTVSRTFNSRDPGAKVDGGILGPGWVPSMPVDDADSDYVELDDTSLRTNPDGTKGDGTVNITESDGTVDTFTQQATANNTVTYTSPTGLEDLKLTKSLNSSPVQFDLKDVQGNDTVFQHQDTQDGQSLDPANVFKPVEIDQVGIPNGNSQKNATILGYESDGNGHSRVYEIIAPPPPGTNPEHNVNGSSDAQQQPSGTRELILHYAPSDTTPPASDDPGDWGDYPNQLQSIEFVVDQSSEGEVAQYRYDAEGRLRTEWDPRISSSLNDCDGGCQNLKETYAYDSGDAQGNNRHLIGVTPPGQQTWNMSYFDSGDGNPGRLGCLTRTDPVAGPGGTPAVAATAVVYGEPTSGAGAPYPMSATNVATWGQTQPPSTATAVFPPDKVQVVDGICNPTTDSTGANLHYLDSLGREVNTATPGGHISTQEYDCPAATSMMSSCYDNVVHSLTPANRERVLAGTSASSLETIDTYSPDGVELVDTLGPMHTGAFSHSGVLTVGQGRVHVVYTYDQGAPLPGTLPNNINPPFHLLTTKKVTFQYHPAGGAVSEDDPHTTVYNYDDPSGDSPQVPKIGWILHEPTSVMVDSGGLNLTTKIVYDSATGNVLQTHMPGETGHTPEGTKTIYYTPGSNPSDSACQNKPEWTNLPCETVSLAQPASGLPALTTTGPISYNSLDKPTAIPTSNGTGTHTTNIQYDDAGRTTQTSISTTPLTLDHQLPPVVTTYNVANGQPETTSTDDGHGTTQTIERRYDTLGRMTGYKDTDTQGGGSTSSPCTDTTGWTATVCYDIDSRPKEVTDGKGTQDMTYDPSTGLLTALHDSDAGNFTATYDADANLATETLPNGLQLRLSHDETGQVVERQYVKQNCSTNCTWLDFLGLKNAVGEWRELSGSLSNQVYTYDGAGRLTRVQDTPTGGTCTTRVYAYDNDSNRLSEMAYPAALDPHTRTHVCSTGTTPTTITHSYDSADRLTDSVDAGDPNGAYDNFGRMTSVAAQDAGGQRLDVQYYADDMTNSMTQNGVSVSFSLDPDQRDRSIQTGSTVEVDHFSDDSDDPSWTQDQAHSTRNIEGIDGDVAAIQDSTSGIQYQLENLHGDIVATASSDPNGTAPTKTFETDEFGVPRAAGGIAQRYGYLGSKRRPAYLASGAIQMGARLYVPEIGRFTSVDPVPGASANPYDYAYGDCVNKYDLDGKSPQPAGPGGYEQYARQLCDGEKARWGAGQGRPRYDWGKYELTRTSPSRQWKGATEYVLWYAFAKCQVVIGKDGGLKHGPHYQPRWAPGSRDPFGGSER
jgi:RHS repeat-associated protein